ncbi:hypothetical protein GKC32_00740 [Lactobacillus curvatus]|nr:hypothetical protein [Latilactobacillus curvatus]MSE23001.1 hypothetical protein [Latilactobacillus curvatus]
MLKVSDAFNAAFAASGRELRARVTIGKDVYSSDDLTSVAYDSGAMTGEQFSIGSTYMNSAKITFSHLVEGLKQLDEVLLEFGIVKADGITEYVKMGTFIIDDKIQMDRNNNSTTIECMDRMVMLGGAYKSKLNYPATIKAVAVEIANMAGVKVNETSFSRLPNQSINEPVGYSYRDAIGIIAQFAMGFALFDRDGYLDIRTLVDSKFKIDPSQYFLKGLVKNETFFKLNGISCTVVTKSKDENGNEISKTTVLQSGSNSGAQIKLANNVMTQDVLDRMYESLKFTNYYPFTLNWNGNPAVEAGDWLILEDMQGNEFKVPNMSYTLTYNGGLTASSKAETSTNSSVTYSYGGSMSNIVNEIGGRESAEGNHIYEGTEDQEPTLPKEGDLWYKHVGPDTEELIYKNGKWEFITSTKTATDAQKAADEASKEAEEAKKQANKAVDGANDAVARAGFANDTAEEAKSNAASALQKAIDAYTHGDQIKTGLTADIDAVKGQVSLKANQVDVDKLGGRVTNAEAQIKLQADQIALTVSKTELTNILGDYATETWTQSQIKSTADQINLSVSKVNSRVDNIATSDRNLLVNTDTLKTGINTGAGGSITSEKYQGNVVAKFDKTSANYADPYQQTTTVTPNAKEYTLSFYAKADVAGDGFVCYFYNPSNCISTITSQGRTSVGTGIDGNAAFSLTTSWARYWVKWTQKTDANAPKHVIIGRTGAALGSGLPGYKNKGATYMSSPMLVEGNITNKAWTAAPEDMATVEKLSELQVTVNGIQGTVQNKADKSQVTQLANQITSTVSQLGTPNYVYNPGFAGNSADGWGLGGVYYMSNNAASSKDGVTALGINLKNIGTTGTKTFKTAISKRMPYSGDLSQPISASVNIRTYEITGDVRFFFTIETFADLTSGRVEYFDSNEITGAQSGWRTSAKLNAKPTKPFKYVAIAYQIAFHGVGSAHGMFCKPMMNFGPTVAPYTDSGISASQITQLSNDINLRVEKNKVVNQINISPEGILIDGKKVHITGQTSIDKAVIKDAMIADVKADKITAGTLNAAHVNVINLNANNITTGTLKGANLSMNLNTGEVLFQKGFITSADGNIRFDLDKSYFRSLDYSQNGFELSNGAFYLFNKGWNGVLSGSDQYLAGKITGGRTLIWSGMDINGTEGLDISVYNSKTSTLGASISLGKAGGSGKDIKALDVSASDIGIGNNGNFIVNNYDGYFSVNSPQINLTSTKAAKVIGGMDITGNFNVVLGSKNAVHPTSDGLRATPAYETAESYLGDIGESATDDDCKKIITMDRLFWEIINTDYEYQVFIAPYSNATIWVEKRNPDSFVVRSNKPNAQFGWELKAKRRGYEKERLVKSNISYEELKNMYESG